MRFALAAAVMSLGMASAAGAATGELSLLPMPASVTFKAGSFSLKGATILAADTGAVRAAERLGTLLRRSGGPELARTSRGSIRFHCDPAVGGAEAYRLTVSPSGVDISASTDAGLYYGAETLWQLIAANGPSQSLRAMDIDDRPAFAWRGVMLDSVRHMQPVSYVKQLIDRMAMAKLNTLQWHLTDDQGWRIQIDRYPRLTSVGAWRHEAGAAGVDPKTGKPLRYGGFYTKANIRSVVQYAAEHHVTIVPEIEMPGHATAMIAAYPELSSIANPPTEPSHNWGILPNLLSPADPTFAFLDNVLDEIIPLFPGAFVHVGGDEAVKDQWKSNPVAQARIRALGLKDEDALQGWFTARVGAYLHQRGKRLIGWDEIMQGAVPPDAAITSWHGLDGAIAAAKSGHDAVLAPAPDLYVDNRQSTSGDEPPGRGEVIDWKRLYDFVGAPGSLSPDQRRHVLGMQVNLWTEHVRTTDYADRMIWPRAAVLGELAWSGGRKDWPKFSARLVHAMSTWRKMGLTADTVPLEVQATFAASAREVSVDLRQPAGIGIIHYALGGGPLNASSATYERALELAPGTELKTQAFMGNLPLGTAKSWRISPELARTRSASELELCGNAIPLRLDDDGTTNGVRLVHWVDIMHPCWIWRGAPLDGIRSIRAQVGQQPFNFAIGDDVKHISYPEPATAAGELLVHRDGCSGPIVATIPLQAAVRSSGDTWVGGSLARQDGRHDLCMTFTQRGIDPFWVLDRLTLQ